MSKPKEPYEGPIEIGDEFLWWGEDTDCYYPIKVTSVGMSTAGEQRVWAERTDRANHELKYDEPLFRRFVTLPSHDLQDRREELISFLKTHGFPQEAVEYFAKKAMRDGFITDKEPPPPSTREDPALRAMEDLERQWKYLEIVWAEYNIYGEK